MPKVEITSQGTRYVDIEDLRRSSTVQETLEFAARTFRGLPGPREVNVPAEPAPARHPRMGRAPACDSVAVTDTKSPASPAGFGEAERETVVEPIRQIEPATPTQANRE